MGAVITKLDKVYTHRDLVAEAQQVPERHRTPLTPEQQRALEEICLQNSSDGQFEPEVPQDWSDIAMGDVGDSNEAHEADEFTAQAHEIMGDFSEFSKGKRQVQRDFRTRRDRILHHTEAFDCQMDEMVRGYLQWSHGKSHRRNGANFFSERPVNVRESEKADGEGHWIGIVVDVFRE
ncbi:hypothetical protein OG21DRAFT_1526948 [Imleria badia]|nr:hypothetical protein OG21DRAFT_1526948 [Imleria badia]